MRREHLLRDRDGECNRDLAVGSPLAWLKRDHAWWGGGARSWAVGARDADVGGGGVEGNIEMLYPDLVAKELPCSFGVAWTEEIASLED